MGHFRGFSKVDNGFGSLGITYIPPTRGPRLNACTFSRSEIRSTGTGERSNLTTQSVSQAYLDRVNGNRVGDSTLKPLSISGESVKSLSVRPNQVDPLEVRPLEVDPQSLPDPFI
jgi:hypothetical protein